MSKSKFLYEVDDITTILSISKSKAYKIIKQLNDELETKGYIIIRGKVPVKYFKERFLM
ncbi:hypothetical protein OQE61_13215 [Cetobacterium somerae]|uniref:hypothetical protein n=1 Tax=Cetobacterium TaxID=180162 RepID=UPI00224F69A3|nr:MULTISPECIES: hypothetical protein [Cetobacterium]MCX3068458.1 hypothetical protein [Cetobacterium somerae]WVJ00245.1 hypothetical protein VSU16_05295 [Cetobacterium somerae]